MKNPIENFTNQKTQKLNDSENLQERLLIEHLEDEYEKKYSYRKSEISEDNYEKEKNEWMDEQKEIYYSEEELNCLLEKKEAELKTEKICPITKLERRNGLYKLIDVKIKELLGVEKNTEIADHEWLEIIARTDANDFKNSNKFIMMSDLSFLGLANDHGHASGDELLKNIGKVFKEFENKKFTAFRHGGDEFTAYIESDEKEIREIISKIRKKFSEQNNIANLAEYGLKPNIDMDIAAFHEALSVYQKLAQTKIGTEKLQKLKPLEELKDLWVDIADKRSFIKKAQTRIALMTKIYLDDSSSKKEKYKKLNNFLGKGGYNIKEEEMEELIGLKENSGEEKKWIDNFILKKEKANLDNIEDGYKKTKAKLIAEVIDIYNK